MTVAPRSTVVGVFQDHAQAERAVRDLLAAGFPKEDIGYLARHPPGEPVEGADDVEGLGGAVGAYSGVAAGTILGGILGAAVSVAVPGFGPLLGAGMVGLMLGGAYVGGIAGALIGMGVPEEEAHAYHRAVEADRHLVAVRANDRYSEALAILAACGALDVTREASPPAFVS
ncbi:MAG: hypothetical protein IT429_19030 [Gemmataceae bacterium]|nr:hypothetical protein [Gemmataceae bacterium]